MLWLKRLWRSGMIFAQTIHSLVSLASRKQGSVTSSDSPVFNMLVKGTGLTEIGLELSLSVKTISTHKTHILQKMNLANTGELIRYAITHGLAEQSEY